jgi:hypothetical protein
MEAPTYVSDTALPQGQQGSSDLPPSPGSSQANAEARYLICGDALQVRLYRLMYIFRHLLRKEHYDMCVRHAAQVMPSGKASRDISERSTIPVYVYFASSNGVAATSTGIISGRSIQVSTPT